MVYRCGPKAGYEYTRVERVYVATVGRHTRKKKMTDSGAGDSAGDRTKHMRQDDGMGIGVNEAERRANIM